MDSSIKLTHKNEINNIHSVQELWLNPDGSKKSTAELKSISRNWDQKTWDAYLDWYEAPLKEELVERYIYERQLDKMEDHIFIFSQKTLSDQKLKRLIKKALSVLPPGERKVIYQIYWEDKNFKEIAEVLGITKGAVFQRKRKALKILKKQPNLLYALSIVGGMKNSPLSTGGINESKKLKQLSKYKEAC